MSRCLRILFLADSHIGLDLPVRPRIERRRRGHDFLANYAAALAPALAGEVDLVVHGGDVFDRPNVPLSIAYEAVEPLRRVAARGVPVFMVPGNHERSRLPHARLWAYPGLHVFDRARTFTVTIRDVVVALSGFPYERRNVRARFGELLERTGWRREAANVRVLCMHHCVEGATVGPGDFTFTRGDDVIRACDLPGEFAAVFSGHIHRHQVLTSDLRGQPLRTAVFYPGSIERTSHAEIGETKGYLVVWLEAGDAGVRVRREFRVLPARPMLRRQVSADGLSSRELEAALRAIVAASPADAVLTIRVTGELSDAHLRVMAAGRLRTIVPGSMNCDVRPAVSVERRASGTRRRREVRGAVGNGSAQLEVAFD